MFCHFRRSPCSAVSYLGTSGVECCDFELIPLISLCGPSWRDAAILDRVKKIAIEFYFRTVSASILGAFHLLTIGSSRAVISRSTMLCFAQYFNSAFRSHMWQEMVFVSGRDGSITSRTLEPQIFIYDACLDR
jgi:hypothetical protein